MNVSKMMCVALIGLFGVSVSLADKKAGDKKHDHHAAHKHAAHKHAAKAGDKSKDPNAKPPIYIKLGKKPKSIEIELITAYTVHNGGMNFNGFSHGKAGYHIPVDWTVHVTFKNKSPVPHSAVVVEEEMASELRVGEPYFDGAATPDFVKGTTTKVEKFKFVADEEGDYVIACGFPAHALAGHWLKFTVGGASTKPIFKTADKVYEAK